ncbi:MAG: OmpA family protein [Saprospiraceae bacterium]|nr:OmpA family protein [Bacteroidia bacterium]NNE14876.1 OmpA family protein [Saprospiraceae bacterium]NNL90809.1 OmpA family protein [Saprospiraceae bacterium]
MQRFIKIICFSLFTATFLLAQPIRENSFAQKLEAAQTAEAQYNYFGALEWYEEVYDEVRQNSGRKSNPEVKKYALKIAELNYRVRDYARAEKSLKKILDKDEDNLFSDWRYIYGMTLKANAKYSDALKEFNKVISLSENEDIIKKAEFEIEGIQLLEGIEPNVETAIGPLDASINSPSAEYSPRESGDGEFYYASLNRKSIIQPGEEDDDEYHAKIYLASKDKEGKLEDGDALDQNVNRIGFHNAHVAFSRDGRTMYFTRVQMVGTETTSSKLMVSYKKDSGWSAATMLPTVNGDWLSKQPAVGQLFGKDVLFFVSDMEGGLGRFDIYYSNINSDGSFSSPVNLGENINTAGDELTPFYYEGTLYFSTDGRPTIGGMDIYYSLWDGTEWSVGENMGLGYNSSYDDLGLSMAEEGGRGYFLSNRPTDKKKKLRSKTCCDDIFAFNIRTIVIDLLAIVVNENDEPLNGATIKLENLSDPINYPTDMKFNSLGNEFQFLLDSDFKYKATITSSGYYPDSINFNTAGILDNYTIKKKITLKAMPVEEEIEVTETVTTNEPIRLNNIYYDFDDDAILEDAEKDLTFLYDLMNEYPTLVIELSSHTDSQGPARYNEDLSQRRANSARQWLLNQGIKKNRIEAVGYGEKRILNQCKNRVPCTDDEHRVNRRTEFKIIGGPKSIEITRTVTKPANK